MELWNWIYVSMNGISSADRGSEITSIVEHSRENNAKLDITGALVFDGAYFAQFI